MKTITQNLNNRLQNRSAMNCFTLSKLSFTFWLAILSNVLCEVKSVENICTTQLTCAECIAVDPKCSWCKQERANEDQYSPRCNFVSNHLLTCQNEYIENPDNLLTVVQDMDMDYHGHIVQIRPQEVNLRLRPGLPYNLRVQFKQAEDFPVDVYYLLDLSLAMADDERDKMISFGNLLAEEISQITTNFRIGFGSFVNGLPTADNLTEVCPECAHPYSFSHHMSLGVHSNVFKENIALSQLSNNVDKSSGGLDAILQSIVCNRIIGWRHNSLKIVIVATNDAMQDNSETETDGTLHVNDGQCHVDVYGSYTASSIMNSPSINQINHKARENKVSLIFAATADQMYFYQDLVRRVEGSVAVQLDYKESILDVIRDKYEQLTSSVTLYDNAAGDFIDMSYYSKCIIIHRDVSEHTRTCSGLKIGTTVTFDVFIELVSCPTEHSNWKQKFSIFPSGVHEELTVTVDMICNCSCENKNLPNEVCKSNGNVQHDEENLLLSHNSEMQELRLRDDSSCKAPNSTFICSGRGSCVEGTCDCIKKANSDEKYAGSYCECDNFSCDRYNGLTCSGSSNGVCICGLCLCNSGWTGPACQCNLNTDGCIAPGDYRICSGYGTCECGFCNCYSDLQERRHGRYCDECPTCRDQCHRYLDCVECKVFQSGTYNEEQCNSHCSIEPEIVDKLEVISDETMCQFRNDEDCIFTFSYGYSRGREYLRVQTTKECPQK